MRWIALCEVIIGKDEHGAHQDDACRTEAYHRTGLDGNGLSLVSFLEKQIMADSRCET